MASRIMSYKGYIIKKTSARDNTTSEYWVCLPDDHNFVDWETDTIEEAKEFIDGKKAEEEQKRHEIEFRKLQRKLGKLLLPPRSYRR